MQARGLELSSSNEEVGLEMAQMPEGWEKDLEQYPEELRPLAKRVIKKRWDNHERVGRLERQGTNLDVVMARLEFTLQQLAEIGVITQEQLLDMALQWEENFALQLAQIEDTVAVRIQQMREAQERQMREAHAQAQKQIATPPSGLLLPNGRVHLPQPESEKKDGQ